MSPHSSHVHVSPTRALVAAAACLLLLLARPDLQRGGSSVGGVGGALFFAARSLPARCVASSSASASAASSQQFDADAPAPPRRLALIMHYELRDEKLPPMLNYVAEACGWQRASVDCLFFVVVADADADAAKRRPAAAAFACRAEDDALPANVRVRVLAHAEWAALLLRAAHVVAQPLGNARKQADYKPLYGDLWSEFLPERVYSHFGWHDPDTILGNVSKFTDGLALDVYTASWPPRIAAGETYIAGQLAIFRNTAALRHVYMQIPNLLPRMDDAAQHGLDESDLGDAVFAAARAFNYSAAFRYDAFQDHPNKPGFDHHDFYFERGRVLAARKCGAEPGAVREGVYIHVAGIKRFPLSDQCAFLQGHERGWAEPRWNLAAVPGDDDAGLVPRFAAFHDEEWGRRGC